MHNIHINVGLIQSGVQLSKLSANLVLTLLYLLNDHAGLHVYTHGNTSHNPRALRLTLAHSLTRSLAHSLAPSLTHSLAHSLARSLTRSLAHSLTHSLTH